MLELTIRKKTDMNMVNVPMVLILDVRHPGFTFLYFFVILFAFKIQRASPDYLYYS